MSDAGKAVFLSYASQDTEAAKRIADTLRAAGVEVWFDQNELVGGDAWDAKIRQQIAECALFVPVISANTQARREGYFRLEWKLAAQRTHMIADGTPFLLPVVIDGTRDTEALVPAEFKGVQWTRLPGGETPAGFCTRVAKLLTGGGESAPGGASPAAPAMPRRSRAAWIGYAGVAVALAGALVYAWRQRGAIPAEPVLASVASPAVSPSGNQGTPARAMGLRALNGLTRERLAAAEDLLAQALKSDPTNAGLLALAAQVDALMVYRSWDPSDERRQAATKRSARALALAPDDFEARRAQALVAGFMVLTPSSLQEAEALYRSLAAERPGDVNVLEELGTILHAQRKFDEAARIFLQAGRTQLAGVSLNAAGRIPEARRIADDLLAQGRSAPALILKANVELFGYNNREAAQAAVNQLTPTELREDDAAGVALRLAVLRRDAEGLLRLLEPFPHPFVSIYTVNYPRQYWTGLARSWQNQPEAAEIEWQGGLRSLQQRLVEKPSDADALSWLAMLHSCLGQRAEMERALRTYGNYRDLSAGRWDWNYCLPLLRFGERKDEVIERLARSLRDTENFNRVLYAWARYSPEFDSLRGDPRFERILRETRPRTAAPYEDELDPAATTPAKADDKSVAVLAFANLSDDKSNEYFSDGISEELLNVLAKVPRLKVSARTSAFYFKGKEVPVPEIAKQLGVAYVVEGSVRKAGDKVRITAQLIKAADGFHVWSDTFTRDLKDIFAVQDEIAGLIARELQLKLDGGGARAAVAPALYELLLQARALALRESNEDWRQAAALYRRTLEKEPGLALAWAEMARIYVQLGRFGGMPIQDAMREARAAAVRALELDPDQATGLVALGWVQRTADWDWHGARRSFQRALELAPGNASTMGDLAVYYFNTGRVAEATTLARQAVERDPLNARAQASLGFILNLNGDWEQALTPLRQAVGLAPAIEEVRSHLARALSALGRLDESAAMAEQEPNEAYRLAARAFLPGRQADLALAEFIAKYGDDMPGYVANIYGIRGEIEPAFAWFERALARRDAAVVWVKTNVNNRSLRADPRWAGFLRKVGLTDEQLK